MNLFPDPFDPDQRVYVALVCFCIGFVAFGLISWQWPHAFDFLP